METASDFAIGLSDYAVRRLYPENASAVQTFFERCNDFNLLVDGEDVSPTSGQDIFLEVPTGRSLADKFLFGVFDQAEQLVGLLEGMWGYPQSGVCWIGLLLLAPASRGQGLGRQLMAAFEDFARAQGSQSLMLGVVEENACAYAFWGNLGFELVRQTEARCFGKKLQKVLVMRKALTGISQPASPAEVTIRPARLEHADLAADLIYLSMGVEADWLFGQEPGCSTYQALLHLFRRKHNRLSYPFAYMADWNGQAAGLLLAYPGRLLHRLDLVTGLHLAQIFGLGGFVRLVRRIPAYRNLVETEADEFYISNLAVLPAFQGRGMGKALMDYAEILALNAGLLKCSLIVTYGHEPARRLYEKLGYQIVTQYDIPHPMIAEGSGGFNRMVKQLTTGGAD